MILLIRALMQIGDKWRLEEKREIPSRFVDAKSGRGLALAQVDADMQAGMDQPQVALKVGPGADEIMQWRIAQGKKELIARTVELL